jgi:hypothetical protein
MAFPQLTLTDGASTITGELVLESTLAWQVAVGGRVGVYNKADWAPVDEGRSAKWRQAADDLADIIRGLRKP